MFVYLYRCLPILSFLISIDLVFDPALGFYPCHDQLQWQKHTKTTLHSHKRLSPHRTRT